MRKILNREKKTTITIYIDKDIYLYLKTYSVETNQSLLNLLAGPLEKLDLELEKLVREIYIKKETSYARDFEGLWQKIGIKNKDVSRSDKIVG